MKTKIFNQVMEVKGNFSYETDAAIEDINNLNSLIEESGFDLEKVSPYRECIETELNIIVDKLQKIS